MHSAGSGMELAQPVLVDPSVPSWGGPEGQVSACPIVKWCMWLSTLWGSEGLDDAAGRSCEEEGDEWYLRSQSRDHSWASAWVRFQKTVLASWPCPPALQAPFCHGRWVTGALAVPWRHQSLHGKG